MVNVVLPSDAGIVALGLGVLGVEGPSGRGPAGNGRQLIRTDAVLHAAEAALLSDADRVPSSEEAKK